MIVDDHTHIFETGRGPRGELASADDLILQMDEAGIDVSVVIPLPGCASNEFVQSECKKHDKRLVALYTPDFTLPRERVVPEMAKFIASNDVRGIKIHPRLQSVTIDDPAVKDVLAWAADADQPVVFDVFPFGPEVPDPRLGPLAYVAAARELPRLTLVLAHAGGYKPIEAFLAAKASPNIMVDVSFTFAYFRGGSPATDLAWLCGRLPPDRLLYGSDWPHQGLRAYLDETRSMIAHVPESTRAALLGNNSRRLYRLG